MLKIFSNNKPIVLVLLPVILIAHYILELNFNYFLEGNNSDTNITGLSFNFFPPFGNYFALLLLCCNAIFLNFIFNSHEFWMKSNYLPSFIYILLNLYFPHAIYFTGELLAQSFVLLILHHLYTLNQQEDARKKSFNIGLFLGLAGLCNPLYLFLLPSIMLSIKFIRPFIFREYFLLIIALLLPFVYLIIFQVDVFDRIFTLLNKFEYSDSKIINFSVFMTVTGLIAIFALFGLIQKSKTSSIRFKKLRNITLSFIIFLSLAIGISLLFGGSVYYCGMLVVPLSFILPYAYLSLKVKGLIEVLTLTIILISIAKFFVY